MTSNVPSRPQQRQLAPGNETPSQRAARQLAELMRRHSVKNAAELERMQRERGASPVVSQVTIRRILKAEAVTEPEKPTLRRLAEFLKETYEAAFPEPGLERAPTIEFAGQQLVLSSPDNRPISPSLVERIRQAIALADSEAAKRK